MNSRAIAAVILGLFLLPIVFIGPQQYGYAFFGYLSLLGAVAKAIGPESPVWMLLFPLTTILIMIFYCGSGIASIVYLAAAMTGRPESVLNYRMTGFIPLAFSICVALGLIFFALFPGEPPIHFTWTLFVAPFLLLISSGIHALPTK